MKKLLENGLTLVVSSPGRKPGKDKDRIFPAAAQTQFTSPDTALLTCFFSLADGNTYRYTYPPEGTWNEVLLQEDKVDRAITAPLPIGGRYFNESVRSRTATKVRED